MGSSEFMIKPRFRNQLEEIRNALDKEYAKRKRYPEGNVICETKAKMSFAGTSIHEGDNLLCICNDRHDMRGVTKVGKKYSFSIYETDALLGLHLNQNADMVHQYKYLDCFQDVDYNGSYGSENVSNNEVEKPKVVEKPCLADMVANIGVSPTENGAFQSENINE